MGPSLRVDALTGLRFFAAAAIVLTHSQTGYFFQPGTFAPFDLAGAVPLFFVLSGFVLTINSAKYASHLDFIVARIARVWPAHIAAIVFLFAIFWPWSGALVQDPEQSNQLVINSLLLQAWSPDRATYWSYNAPSWSVSVEMFLYLVFPVCLVILARSHLIRVLAFFVAVLGLLWTVAVLFPGLDPNWLAAVNPVVNLPTFAVGIVFALYFQRVGRSEGHRSLLQFSVIGLAIVANAVAFNLDLTMLPYAVGAYLHMALAVPFYALLIVCLARFDGLPSRFLSLRPIVFLGEISFAIYLFHQLIIRWHSTQLETFAGIPYKLQYAGIWVATIAVATASQFLVERPARHRINDTWRRLRRRFDRAVPGTAGAGPLRDGRAGPPDPDPTRAPVFVSPDPDVLRP